MNEREFELAQQIEQLQRDAAIELARAQCQGAGSEECVVCGEPIPAARRACVPYATRCTECQGRFEQRNTGIRDEWE
ncbi:TraR/DksA C4-type zinc finger protein [Burkholderia multivorans]|nr:TraR/DksA C4-type zinc finger protein [Burkholderia multivorans]MCO7347884.1 TraR/DksA C4-type zinc finger protein [Burkholderia multivorans]QET32447.1 hypothetical protein FOB31_22040 [Burkholderia multivorans]QET38283.1 hypothetical protein FOB30_08530 [Burkholderia multivorans]HDR9337180.1 TraR/DksA C4-type zinc finger protein [Burkholderia multivorans]HDR9349239.1 TraR/DksA C4-type zinc finger protein [Burkholderia multivorans]